MRKTDKTNLLVFIIVIVCINLISLFILSIVMVKKTCAQENWEMIINIKGYSYSDLVDEAETIIGIGDMNETAPNPPETPQGSTVLAMIKDINMPITYHFRDIRIKGSEQKIWILKVEINEDIYDAFGEESYPEITWTWKNNYIPSGRVQLRRGKTHEIEDQVLLVEDMITTNAYQTQIADGTTSLWYTITWESPAIIFMDLSEGWSMISLPVLPDNALIRELFPGAVVVYGYKKGSGYVRVKEEEELKAGTGYWILLNEGKIYALNGQTIKDYNLSINEDGWFMIGGCTYQAKASIKNGNIGVIYSYAQGTGYQRIPKSENLTPGKGYWIQLKGTVDKCELTVTILNNCPPGPIKLSLSAPNGNQTALGNDFIVRFLVINPTGEDKTLEFVIDIERPNTNGSCHSGSFINAPAHYFGPYNVLVLTYPWEKFEQDIHLNPSGETRKGCYTIYFKLLDPETSSIVAEDQLNFYAY